MCYLSHQGDVVQLKYGSVTAPALLLAWGSYDRLQEMSQRADDFISDIENTDDLLSYDLEGQDNGKILSLSFVSVFI
jgi:hypothetical protein